MSEPVIEVKDLSLAFRQNGLTTEVLRGLDLTVKRGDFLAIVGASGVGKSTLLRVLMKLASPSSGSVIVHPDPETERQMALVFQDARLLPWRRVLPNVTLGLEKTSMPKAERRERGMALLRTVGLGSHADRFPHQLSGGQRQRAALARALAVDPSILLMDEPFSALDALTREGLQDELIRIWTAYVKTILFVTHDIEEAVYLSNRVIAIGGKPGEVKATIEIDVSRPRSRSDMALKDYAREVRRYLVEETSAVEDFTI